MSATTAAVKPVRLLQSQRRPWYLLRLPSVQFWLPESRRIKRAWRVSLPEVMTGGLDDGIAIRLRPCHLRR